MSLATATLPTDPDALRMFAARLQAELYAKTLHIEKLKAELALLKRARYGRSSERIEQLELLIGELEADEAEHEAKEPAAAPDKPRSTGSPPRGRQPLPAHLPRERVEHEPACACPACGSTRLSRIGTDERELLEYVPSHFKVVVHVRPKLSCRQCATIRGLLAASLPGIGSMASWPSMGACPAQALRRPRRHQLAARPGGAGAHRPTVHDRGRDQRS